MDKTIIEPEWRGKRIDNGEWVEGDKQNTKSGICIFPITDNHLKLSVRIGIKVDPATLCRNTTAKIRDSIVWEGDLFKNKDGDVFEISWCKESYVWSALRVIDGVNRYWLLEYIIAHCKRIGNRFDNPELLGGK